MHGTWVQCLRPRQSIKLGLGLDLNLGGYAGEGSYILLLLTWPVWLSELCDFHILIAAQLKPDEEILDDDDLRSD